MRLPDERRVVVTGLGTINPCGLDVPSTWDAMVHARSGTGRLTRFSNEGLASIAAGEVDGFDPIPLLGRRTARRVGRFTLFALTASHEALLDAGLDPVALTEANEAGWTPDADPWLERFGVCVGTGIGGFPEITDAAEERMTEGTRRISPLFIPRSLNNLATGQVAMRFGARGPSLCIATACAVGNHSIGEAAHMIRRGDADVMLAGGTEAALSPLGYGGFMTMRALSRNTDTPETASRPFDRTRDGFVMAEGAGVLVLESLAHARARGARIHAELVGYACTTDAHHVTAPAPGHAGAVRCMSGALRSAGIRPEQVDYINAHGTSTPVNDVEETRAIRTVFGDHADQLVVSSTKGVTGHLLGAAGGLEAIAAVRSITTGVIPPTAHLHTPDPECDLDYCPLEARDLGPKVVLSNGFGFGGTNACLVFQAI